MLKAHTCKRAIIGFKCALNVFGYLQKSWCELIGGSDYKHHVRRVLSRLFDHEFSLMVNMSGLFKNGKKISFGNLHTCMTLLSKLIQEATNEFAA